MSFFIVIDLLFSHIRLLNGLHIKNMTTALIKERNDLEFRADFFPMTVIKLTTDNLLAIKKQIVATVILAPSYFKHAPIVIDLHEVQAAPETIDLEAICTLLREQKMLPIGIRGLDPSIENRALSLGLAIMKTTKSVEKKEEPSLSTGVKKKIPGALKTNSLKTKLITTPVRAGTQVYARNGDLVVTAPVNAGGECFADGNIHIYGPLRGKALAGIRGNPEARIFCESFEAEFVAISGHYLTRENMRIPKTEKPMIQIYLKDSKIQIEGI